MQKHITTQCADNKQTLHYRYTGHITKTIQHITDTKRHSKYTTQTLHLR